MYVEGFVVPVPRDKQDAYRAHVERVWPIFKEHGALRLVEATGDDVPVGRWTDFHRAVNAEATEVVVFAWIEWPSKAVREAAHRKIAADARAPAKGEMPFDTRRMIFGGFAPLFDGRA